jgi:uncharacterized protein involved in exopolysaccharide biosynthesis
MQAQSRDLVQGQPVVTVLEGLFRHKRLFSLLAISVLLMVVGITLAAKRQYRSEMKFLLENNRSNAVIAADRSAAPPLTEITEQQVNSELEVLGSEDVLQAVADPSWRLLPANRRTPDAIKQHQDKVDRFRKRLIVEPAKKSNVINVSFIATSPEEARDTLARFSSAYLAHRKLLSRPTGTSKFFAEQANRYKETWEKANRELVAFQQQNQLVSPQDTEQTLSKEIAGEQDELRANQASLAETNGRLSAGNKAVVNVPERQQTQQHTIVSQSSVDQMRTLLVQLQNRKTELTTRYTPTDRLVVEVNREIADTTASLKAALAQKGQEDTTDVNPAWQRVKNMVVEGGINRQALLGRGQSLQQSIADLQGRLAQLQSLDVRFNALQEQSDQARSNFETFSQKRDQAEVEDAMDERKLINIAVAQSPTSTFRPVSPKPLLNSVLGLLTALLLASGAVYLAEYVRSTIANARELELISRYPVLATVPYATESDAAVDFEASPEWFSPRDRDSVSAPRMIPAMQNYGKVKEA